MVMDFALIAPRHGWQLSHGGIYGVSKSTGNPPTTAYYWGTQDAGATLPPFTALLLFKEGVVLKKHNSLHRSAAPKSLQFPISCTEIHSLYDLHSSLVLARFFLK